MQRTTFIVGNNKTLALQNRKQGEDKRVETSLLDVSWQTRRSLRMKKKMSRKHVRLVINYSKPTLNILIKKAYQMALFV